MAPGTQSGKETELATREENVVVDVDAKLPLEEGGEEAFSEPGNKVKLECWKVENDGFWEKYGKKIANINLYISIPNLTLAFATWIIWSVIAVKIQNIHEKDPTAFTFAEWQPGMTKKEYKGLVMTLPAVAGLSGATLRMSNSFMVAPIGGRNVIYLTSIVMFVPMLWGGFALLDKTTSFMTLVIVAALSGAGGGVFASSMSNISFFFPKRMQGLALGLNGGIGNLGVSITQLVAPLFMTLSTVGVGYGLLFYCPLLAFFSFMAWWKMNNLPHHDTGSSYKAAQKFFWLEGLTYAATAVGVAFLIGTKSVFTTPGLKILRSFIMVGICVSLGVFFLRKVTPEAITGDLNKTINTQFLIFKNKHTHIMTYLYIMTFGSFIGFSAAFPGIIKNVFGYLPGGDVPDPLAPQAFNYSWMGAAIGSLIRPVGGWLSDKYGGAFITQISTIVLIASTFAVGAVVRTVQLSDDVDERRGLFPLFVFLFLILFASTGVGNGSTFTMVPALFEKEQSAPVLGWISAMAAYGAFIIPAMFGVAIASGSSDVPFWGFGAYYVSCLFVNWWYYARSNAPNKC